MEIVGAAGLGGLCANFLLDQSIGIDETNTLQLKFFMGGLWALEWAWHIRVTNLRYVQIYI